MRVEYVLVDSFAQVLHALHQVDDLVRQTLRLCGMVSGPYFGVVPSMGLPLPWLSTVTS